MGECTLGDVDGEVCVVEDGVGVKVVAVRMKRVVVKLVDGEMLSLEKVKKESVVARGMVMCGRRCSDKH